MTEHPSARRTVEATLSAVVAGLQVHADTATGEIKKVAEDAAPVAVELATDWAGGHLSGANAMRGLRKLELSVETAIARITRDEARKAAKGAIGNLLSGAVALLGSIF